MPHILHGVHPFKPTAPQQVDQLAPGLESDNAMIYLPMGPFSEFRGLIRRHYIATEHAMDGDDPQEPPPADPYMLGDVEFGFFMPRALGLATGRALAAAVVLA